MHYKAPSHRNRAPFDLGWYGLLACTCLLAGCDSAQGPICYPVRGQLQQAGKPVAEALVVFHYLDNMARAIPKPMAFTDEHGAFELMTLQTGDGAPAGKYAITVELRAPRQVGEEMVRDGKNQLPMRYAKPASSGLSANVAAGENQLPLLIIEPR